MGILETFKKLEEDEGVKVQSAVEAELEAILNRMFYLEKDIDEETAFIKHIMTRGAETQERIGLHASALIEPPSKYCERQQLLSLIYRQTQGEETPVGLKRIFEEGNAIHEKWQRLFIRAGYSKHTDLDKTIFNDDYQLSYTPDIICTIPEFSDKSLVIEVKSMNTYSYKKNRSHSSGKKQLHLYMHLTGIHQGAVLMEDKNTQEFKVRYYTYDAKEVETPVGRLNRLSELYKKHFNEAFENIDNVVKCEGCDSPYCKRAEHCSMKGACWNVENGKRYIQEAYLSEDELEAWSKYINIKQPSLGTSDMEGWNI